MASLRRHEGYYMVDHRASPGLPDVPEGTMYEAATITCRHCQTVLLRNPMRTRERAYCTGCDHYICDQCAVVRKVTMECQDIQKVFDRLQHEAVLLLGSQERNDNKEVR